MDKYERRIDEVLSYCASNIEQMWAAKTAGTLLGCDFRDSKSKLAEMGYFEPEKEARVESMKSKIRWAIRRHDQGGDGWLTAGAMRDCLVSALNEDGENQQRGE